MTEYLQQLVRFDLYKRNQGRVARQVTLLSLAVVVAAGAWSLRVWMQQEGYAATPALFVPLGVLVAGCWAAFRWIQLPRFADFLISVEAEMNKVSWPDRAELWKASIVVIVTMFFLAAVLFFYDVALKQIILPLIEGALDFITGLFG